MNENGIKEKSVAKNAFLSMGKTAASIIFPLITFPYVSRILEVEQLGDYSFCTSIISYFTLLASLGVSNYAIREGAKLRRNRDEVSQFVSEAYTVNVFATILSYILLLAVVLIVPRLWESKSIILILSIEIFFITLGANWIYNIFEEFWVVTVVTILCQFVSLILMFLFVRSTEDLLVYTSISIFVNVGSGIIYRIYSRKYVDIRLVLSKKIFIHLKPILLLFSTSVVSTIYISSDTTVLGFLSDNYHVGLYSVSMKVYKIVKQLFLAIVTVSIPRIALLFGRKERAKSKDFLSKTFNTILLLCIPAMVGLVCVSRQVILLLSGEEYLEATTSLQILSIALIFSIFSSFYANCILIPAKEERKVLIATIVSAVVNLGLNIILIPFWDEKAAAFTTMLSELLMTIICACYSRRIIKLDANRRNILSITIGAIGIIAVCVGTSFIISNDYIYLLVAIPLSVIIYGLVQIICKNSMTQEFFALIGKRKGR